MKHKEQNVIKILLIVTFFCLSINLYCQKEIIGRYSSLMLYQEDYNYFDFNKNGIFEFHSGADLDGLTRAEWLNKLSSGDYPGIYDYYVRFGVNEMQHEQMAAHYRNIIQNMLAEFQPGLSQNIYEALAWVGLIGRGPIDSITGLPTNPTSAWSNLSQTERLTILNTISNFNNNGNEDCN